MGKKELSFVKLVFCSTVLSLLYVGVNCIQVMEIMAAYRIQSVANNNYLTVGEQGILGLTTGRVFTAPYEGRMEQQWSMIWDPSMDKTYHGYRLESRKEYLNRVTSFYPDESTTAVPNIWEVIELNKTEKQLLNKRTRKCLQIMKQTGEVSERTCSPRNRFQKWRLQEVDLQKRI